MEEKKIEGQWEMLDVDGYSPPRVVWRGTEKRPYYAVLMSFPSSSTWKSPLSVTTQATVAWFGEENFKYIISDAGSGELSWNDGKTSEIITYFKNKPTRPDEVGQPWNYYTQRRLEYVWLVRPDAYRYVETNSHEVFCKLWRQADTPDKKYFLTNIFKFTGDWNKVNCDIPRPTQCSIPPSVQELMNQNNKSHFVIAKAKPSLHHALYLFNPSLDDIVYSKDGDMRSNITALKNVPRYNVFECKWTPAGKANLRFSDCSDDICEDKNQIIANGLDQLIKDKIGNLQGGNENQFLAEKFPVCCQTFDKDSTLTPQIQDALDKYEKTFYLLGKKKGQDQPKLYLFDLGQVQGGLTYKFIKDAVVLKQVNCKWVEDAPLKQDVKFSEFEFEIDTNFYLLTLDKLDKPSNITVITQRKANEYLVKHFQDCSIKKPEGGKDPNDDLKPDFGGGGGSGGGGSSGGGGFFPEHNNPLPNPEVPNCTGGVDAGSQTPQSEIYLLSVPELSPSYADTYDFTDKSAQFGFFASKKNIKLINYSYLRKENAIQIGSHVDNVHCYNYLMYKNKFGKWYYCFILNKQYINERTTKLTIATDVIQTYLFDFTLAPSYVERCHVDRWKADGTPTDEFEPEGLEFGDPMQESWTELPYQFKDTYIAVCSNPLGEIPSRSILKKSQEGGEKNGI